jgi:hypothetical protein
MRSAGPSSTTHVAEVLRTVLGITTGAGVNPSVANTDIPARDGYSRSDQAVPRHTSGRRKGLRNDRILRVWRAV